MVAKRIILFVVLILLAACTASGSGVFDGQGVHVDWSASGVGVVSTWTPEPPTLTPTPTPSETPPEPATITPTDTPTEPVVTTPTDTTTPTSEPTAIDTPTPTSSPTAEPIPTDTLVPPTETPTDKPPTSTPTPAATLAVELVSNVTSSTGRVFAIDTVAANKLAWADRTTKMLTVPAGLVGRDFIRSWDADKAISAAAYLSFTLSQPATVYVALDGAQVSLPGWMDSSWNAEGEVIGTGATDSLRLMSKVYPVGVVVLGGNAVAPRLGTGKNYVVIVSTGGALPTPAPTATPTETLIPTDTPTATDTVTPAPTETPLPTITSTPLPGETPTATPFAAVAQIADAGWTDDAPVAPEDRVYPAWWIPGAYPEPPVWWWTVVTKPDGSTVLFEDVYNPNARIWLDTAGIYVLRGCVFDGLLTGCDEVIITVNSSGMASVV